MPTPNEHPRTGTKHISIRDVARAARCSIATVSRVLNESPSVTRPTADKVQEAIKKLGYTPNPLAQVLGSRSTHVIGLALPRFHGEFMSYLLAGADEEATTLGYHLLTTTIATGVDGKRRRKIIGSGLVDGMLVVITDAEDPLTRDVLEAGIPTVILDTDMSKQGLDSVILDNDKGARDAVDHLLRWVEPGNLYFVGGTRGNFDTIQRARAFSAALSAAGFEPRPDQVSFGEYSMDWGKEWAMRMIQRKSFAPSSAPESAIAVLAANDKIACGIIHAAHEAQLVVPDQLRVVGFNDSLISRIVEPQLSSIALPMAEMGAVAVRLLIRRLENNDAEVLCRRLPTRLVIRQSSTARNF